MKLIDRTDELFLEFFGALIGDGCIVKFKRKDRKNESYRIFISVNAKSDLAYLENHLKQILLSYEINPYIRIRKNTNTHNANTADLIINNKGFAEFLIEIGFPVGKKGQIQLPDWALKLSKPKQLAIIRGIFDTDGCLSARKSENYRRPFVLISSQSKPLLNQIKAILRKTGLPAYVSGTNVGINGIENTTKWFNTVSSSNNRNLYRYSQWQKTGKLPMTNIKTS